MFRNLFEHPLFIIVLLVLVAVLFGGKRLPDAARGLGRSLRIFKSEVKQMREDDGDEPRDRADRGARPDRDDVADQAGRGEPAEPRRTAAVEGRVVDARDERAPHVAGEQRDTRA